MSAKLVAWTVLMFLSATRITRAASEPESAEISAFDCSTVKPIQVYLSDGKFAVSALDISTGKYTLLYYVRLPSGATSINAVGINPLDGKAYGVIKGSDGFYVVRFDSTRSEYTAKVPVKFSSGGYSKAGDLYLTKDKQIWKFANSHKWVGKINSGDALDLSNQEAPQWEGKAELGGDMVVWSDGKEGSPDYALAMKNKEVMVVNLASLESWKLKSSSSGLGFAGTWGSAWLFGGQAYFANNGGKGVYRADPATMDVEAMTIQTAFSGESLGMG